MEDKKKSFIQAIKDGFKPMAERYGANKKPNLTPISMGDILKKKKKKDLQSED